jgi:hypothetical protein
MPSGWPGPGGPSRQDAGAFRRGTALREAAAVALGEGSGVALGEAGVALREGSGVAARQGSGVALGEAGVALREGSGVALGEAVAVAPGKRAAVPLGQCLIAGTRKHRAPLLTGVASRLIFPDRPSLRQLVCGR